MKVIFQFQVFFLHLWKILVVVLVVFLGFLSSLEVQLAFLLARKRYALELAGYFDWAHLLFDIVNNADDCWNLSLKLLALLQGLHGDHLRLLVIEFLKVAFVIYTRRFFLAWFERRLFWIASRFHGRAFRISWLGWTWFRAPAFHFTILKEAIFLCQPIALTNWF